MKQFTFNSIPNCICVYKISNTINDKVYIGSTNNLNSRIIQHRYDSIHRKNNCPKLYEAINTIGSDNFFVEIIEEFINIDMIELHNIETKYMNIFNSIDNGYNERKDIDGKCITSISTSKKMSNSGKNIWKLGIHKDHARKLSKFKYNIYTIDENILDEDILAKDITIKYSIASSNLFEKIKKRCIKLYGFYDETKTIKVIMKNYKVERIYIGGTTRGDYKSNSCNKNTRKDNSNNLFNNMTFEI